MTAPAAPANAGEVREAHRIDVDALAAWLGPRVDGLGGPLVVRQFEGGQSNPTYWLSDGIRAWVLRKKPPGKLLPSAHAVEREHRVMAALAGSGVPVPRMIALCEDPGVVGTPFFVMEHVEGRIFHDLQLRALSADERRAIWRELVRVLAALHRVDPLAVGLGDYGRTAREGRDGYVARQVERWTRQYEASRTGDVPEMDRLIAWLPAHVPEEEAPGLVHGDYRLDNLVIHPTAPRVVAVLDWELSTLGNPLADLAYVAMLYEVQLPRIGGLAGVDFAATGLPTEAELVEWYRADTGRDTVPDLAYHKAFSLFRLAAIAQGVYARSLQGNASSAHASMYGAAVPLLAGIAGRLVGLG